MTFPPPLKKGDTIGITCPAGYMAAEKIQTCVTTLQGWGYEVIIGKTVGSSSKNYFSAPDEYRLSELQAMLDAPEVKAILFGRGGYGTGRIIDLLDFKHFRKHPKWLIGYSDITLLHTHINKNFRIATLHAPMAAAFENNGFKNKYIQSIKDAIAGKKALYFCKPHKYNKTGTAIGELIGGNLSLLAHSCGTSSEIKTKGKILFLEDLGEQLYHIDRMLYQLKRSGKLSSLAGLIIGGFTDLKNTERPFGKTLYQLITELVQEYNYPVCFQFPVGHTKENYALKCGAVFQLKISTKGVKLVEV
jgi:muramoyltetrapeptide carboxypeptidase